jgi:2-succinyl-6-hydroxy-2,4-cyclohexadiene-1-carboxylate synthase
MLLALHGFTETDLVWQSLLSPHFSELTCPLLPGHGWKPCLPEASLSDVAADFLAKIPGTAPFDLLGYSMGGRVALRMALDHPERIRRLVLISSNPGIMDDSERAQRAERDELLAQILEEDGIGPFVAWWQANPTLAPFKPLPRSVAESLRCMRLNHEPEGLAAALRHLGSSDEANNLWPRLSELRMPVLLMAGSADARYRAIMTAMHQRIAGSRLEIVAEAGHAIHREQAEPMLAVIRAFLAD